MAATSLFPVTDAVVNVDADDSEDDEEALLQRELVFVCMRKEARRRMQICNEMADDTALQLVDAINGLGAVIKANARDFRLVGWETEVYCGAGKGRESKAGW